MRKKSCKGKGTHTEKENIMSYPIISEEILTLVSLMGIINVFKP